MRRMVLAAVLAVAMLAMLVPPAMAQTPKVTITGLFDQVMSVGKNYSESNFSRDSDQEWYARTRFRPDFTFEVGRVKAVMGLELDLTYGQVGSCGGGNGKNQSAATMHAARLKRIAEENGGRFYTPETIAGLPEDLRYTGRGVTTVEERELWHMPIVLFALLGLISAEWAYRRAVGMA